MEIVLSLLASIAPASASGRDVEFRVDGCLVRIVRLAAEGYDRFDDVATALASLRRRGLRADLFTFVQNVSEKDRRHGYFMEWDNVAAMPVSTFDHWWRHQVNDKVRNQVRRAWKSGVRVWPVPFDTTLVEGISAIYNESPMRQGRAFWHYGKGLDAVRQENATFLERSVFLGAYHGIELIGFAKLVLGHDEARLMQIIAMVRHRDKSVSNALIAEAVRTCADRKIPYLVYSKFYYGKKQRDGLSRLTTYLPEMALAPLRRARAFWSERRFPAVNPHASAVTHQLIGDA